MRPHRENEMMVGSISTVGLAGELERSARSENRWLQIVEAVGLGRDRGLGCWTEARKKNLEKVAESGKRRNLNQ